MDRSMNGCVVLAAPLTVAVRSFLDRWGVERPSTAGSFGVAGGGFRVEVDVMSGIEWLAGESGVSEETIYNICRGRYRTSELSTADALVQALGHPEWFYDGTLTVVPNPSAPRALREECCGSSESSSPVAA